MLRGHVDSWWTTCPLVEMLRWVIELLLVHGHVDAIVLGQLSLPSIILLLWHAQDVHWTSRISKRALEAPVLLLQVLISGICLIRFKLVLWHHHLSSFFHAFHLLDW